MKCRVGKKGSGTMKFTTSISDELFNILLEKYKNKTLTNDEWSLMTPALRKRIERQAKK